MNLPKPRLFSSKMEKEKQRKNPSEFQHDPIDTKGSQIRLIRLSRDLSPDGFVQCDISVTNFSAQPKYRAISYVWGSKKPFCQIRIRGRLLTIRDNLWQFLNTYRLQQPQGEDNFLWIDQITIDQQNVAERNHQVSLMGAIFSKATQVVAWLGQSDPHYAMMEAASQRHPEKENELHPYRECSENDTCPLCRTGSARSKRPCKLLDSPYWNRLWITQEVILAENIIFLLGDYQLTCEDIWNFHCRVGRTWNYMMSLLLQLRLQQDHRKYVSSQNINAEHSRQVLKKEKPTLSTIIGNFDLASLECTDARDLVFGILGLCRDPIEVNYELQRDDIFGELLDKAIREFGPPNSVNMHSDFLVHMAGLKSRFGAPLRWRVWLHNDTTFLTHGRGFSDFLDCLRALEWCNFKTERWPIAELGAMVCAIASNRKIRFHLKRNRGRGPYPLIERFIIRLNSLQVPSHSLIPLKEPATILSRWWHTTQSKRKVVELKRVARYKSLIKDFIKSSRLDFPDWDLIPPKPKKLSNFRNHIYIEVNRLNFLGSSKVERPSCRFYFRLIRQELKHRFCRRLEEDHLCRCFEKMHLAEPRHHMAAMRSQANYPSMVRREHTESDVPRSYSSPTSITHTKSAGTMKRPLIPRSIH